MDLIAFGDREKAQKATAPRPRDARPRPRRAGRAGRPLAGGDALRGRRPVLLLWILATLVDSAVIVYERYVARLRRAEKEALWEDYKVVGRVFGLTDAQMPADWRAFRAYMADMIAGDDLHVSDEARELAIQIVMRPPVPLKFRPALELANQITVGLLPRRLRREYGFRWDPVREVAARTGAEYTKRVLVPLLPDRCGWSAVRARRVTPAGRAASG